MKDTGRGAVAVLQRGVWMCWIMKGGHGRMLSDWRWHVREEGFEFWPMNEWIALQMAGR